MQPRCTGGDSDASNEWTTTVAASPQHTVAEVARGKTHAWPLVCRTRKEVKTAVMDAAD
jgi:hypothetical protein